MMRLVEPADQSIFDALWRQFPGLKYATCVGRCGRGWKDDKGGIHVEVTRTFRTIEGSYRRIHSTIEGNEIIPIPAQELDIYERVWSGLGSRAYGEPTNNPSGILFASWEFLKETEELIEELEMEEDG